VWVGCVAWQASLFYSFSADGGASWLSPSVAVAPIDDAGAIPALSLGPNDELMTLYPNGPPGEGRFYAARLTGGAWQPPSLVSDGSTDWHSSGNYDETGWYGGDSGGALMYDPTSDRSIAVFPDRRGQRGPRLYSAVWADLNLRRTFVPLIRR